MEGNKMANRDFLTHEDIRTNEPSRMPGWWTMRKFESALDTLVSTSCSEAPRDFPLPSGMKLKEVDGKTLGVIDHGPFHIEWLYGLNGGFTYKSRVYSIEARLKDGSTFEVLASSEHQTDLAKNSPIWSALRANLKEISQEITEYQARAVAAHHARSAEIDRSISS